MPVASGATYAGLANGARAFVLAAIAGAALWAQAPAALGALLALAAVWVTCAALARTSVPLVLITWLESSWVALVAALYHQSAPALLVALVVPPFAHGLARGIRGALESLTLQVITLAVVLRVHSMSPDVSELSQVFTWLVTGLGLGLVASFFVSLPNGDDNSSAYLEARSLLADLNDLSARLVGGLDPSSMTRAVLEEVKAELPVEDVVLHVERDERLLPLRPDGSAADEPASALSQRAWSMAGTLVDARDFAFAISHEGATIAVVSGRTTAGLEHDSVRLTNRLDSLSTRLAPAALRLDTAQMFATFRDAATSQERQRLAREMHDGMAQDIASMGYVVDALLATASPEQERTLHQLRGMITRVVAEVRRSVTTLRNQPESSESLGAAIASVARDLSALSGIAISVTVDERTRRLSSEIEAELLRIAQEALNNAVKHSEAASIDVTCRVHAPFAEVSIADNGRGLQAARSDSHGLTIMRERAALIGATLEIESRPRSGTLVRVRVGAPPPDSPHANSPATNAESPGAAHVDTGHQSTHEGAHQ